MQAINSAVAPLVSAMQDMGKQESVTSAHSPASTVQQGDRSVTPASTVLSEVDSVREELDATVAEVAVLRMQVGKTLP